MKNSERFEQFIQKRCQLEDWDKYISRDKTRLVRKKIMKGYGVSRSTLYQNPAVKQRLNEVEAELRRRGVLCWHNCDHDMLIDESAVLVVAVELDSRLDSLDERMALVLTSIEQVRRQLQHVSKG